MSERCRYLSVIKKIMENREMGMNVKMELYEMITVLTVTYG